jgi:hypothetical protein
MREIERLGIAVDEFAAAMKRRLRSKYRQRYTGWEQGHPTSKLMREANEDTSKILEGDDVKKNSVDVANRMMMIWRRCK